MEQVRQLLDDQRRQLLDLVLPLPSWDVHNPNEIDGWTIGQILHHLVLIEGWATEMVEELLSGRMPDEETLAKNPNKYPIKVLRYRKVKVPAFEFALPAPFLSRDVILKLMEASRANHLAALEKAMALEDWEHRRHFHPLLGSLPLKDWMELPAYHDERHRQQIEEILAAAEK